MIKLIQGLPTERNLGLAGLLGLVLVCGACTSLQVVPSSDVLKPYKISSKPIDLKGEFSLARAKQYALRANPDITSAQARIQQAMAQLKQAQSGYFPSVTASAGYSHTEWSAAMGSTVGPGGRSNTYSAGLGASWLLYDGLNREFTDLAARYGAESSKEASADVQRLLCEAVAQAFYSTLLQKELMLIAKADAEFNKDLLGKALEKRKEGVDSKSDELNFKINYNAARSSFITSRRDYRTARMALAELLGIENGILPEKLVPKAQELPRDDAKFDPNAMVAAALSRPDLKLLANSLKAAEAGLKAAHGARLPSVAATANYGYARPTNPRFNSDDRSGNVGLALDWDVDLGGLKRQRYLEAKAALREAEANLRKKRNSIYKEVRQDLENLSTSRENVKILGETAGLAKELRDLEKERWRLGVASITRLNEVQTNLVRADGALAVAKIRVLLNLEILKSTAFQNLPK